MLEETSIVFGDYPVAATWEGRVEHGRPREFFQMGAKPRVLTKIIPVFRRAKGANENFRDFFGILDSI